MTPVRFCGFNHLIPDVFKKVFVEQHRNDVPANGHGQVSLD